MRPARIIAGCRLLRVTGAEPERFLTELARRGVSFWNASPPVDYTMTVYVVPGRKKAVRAAAAASGCEAETLSLRGLPKIAEVLRKRPLAAVLLASALLAALWSRAYVWDITVEGSETVPDGVILQALSECGVEIGASWLGFSQDVIRNELILRVPSLRWATVTMQGCRARVIVRERLTHEPIADESRIGDIAADRIGIITEVHALHGTAVMEPGQACLPGETLIAGISTGRFGVLGPTWPAGTVRARTWYELTTEAPAAVLEKTSSGASRVRYALILGKNRINFYKDSSICPPGCDKITERVRAGLDGLFLLPLAVERIVVTPYETASVPAAELREELDALLDDTLRQAIGEDGEILSAVYTASETGGVLRVTLRAECEEQIGVFVPAEDADGP